MSEDEKVAENEFVITRDMIIRELAKRLDFTVKDVSLIFWGFEELMKEAVAQNKKVNLYGFITLEFLDVAGHDGWDAFRNKAQYIPSYRKIIISPSKTLKRILKMSVLPEEEKEGLKYFENDLNLLFESKKQYGRRNNENHEESLELDDDWDEMVNEEE